MIPRTLPQRLSSQSPEMDLSAMWKAPDCIAVAKKNGDSSPKPDDIQKPFLPPSSSIAHKRLRRTFRGNATGQMYNCRDFKALSFSRVSAVGAHSPQVTFCLQNTYVNNGRWLVQRSVDCVPRCSFHDLLRDESTLLTPRSTEYYKGTCVVSPKFIFRATTQSFKLRIRALCDLSKPPTFKRIVFSRFTQDLSIVRVGMPTTNCLKNAIPSFCVQAPA